MNGVTVKSHPVHFGVLTYKGTPIHLARQVPFGSIHGMLGLSYSHNKNQPCSLQTGTLLPHPSPRGESPFKCKVSTSNRKQAEPWALPAQHLPGYLMILTPEA